MNYLGPAFLAAAFFYHVFLPKREIPAVELKTKMDLTASEIDAKRESILQSSFQFSSGLISDMDFRDKATLSKTDLEELEMTRQAFQDEYDLLITDYRDSYFGFISRRLLYYNVSLMMLFFVAGVVIIYLGHKLPDKRINLKKSATITGFVFGTIGFYFLAWILVDQQDIGYNYYIGLLITLGLVGSSIGLFLSRLSFERVSTLKSKIRFLMNLLIVKTVDKNLVNDIEVYTEEIINPAIENTSE